MSQGAKVIRMQAASADKEGNIQRAGAPIVERLTLPALSGRDAHSGIADEVRALKQEVARTRAVGERQITKATIELLPVSPSGEPEIFRISLPPGQQIAAVWLEIPTGPLGTVLNQIVSTDASSAIVALTNLSAEKREVRVVISAAN